MFKILLTVPRYNIGKIGTISILKMISFTPVLQQFTCDYHFDTYPHAVDDMFCYIILITYYFFHIISRRVFVCIDARTKHNIISR